METIRITVFKNKCLQLQPTMVQSVGNHTESLYMAHRIFTVFTVCLQDGTVRRNTV